MRKSFIVYIDMLEILDDLTDEERGQLFYGIYKFQTEEEIELPKTIKLLLKQFTSQFERDNLKWNDTVEKRREAGRKGGLNKAKKTTTEPTRNKFIVPKLEEIEEYSNSYSTEKSKKKIDSESFYNFYESKGWMVGKNKMKDWKAAVRQWYKDQPTVTKNNTALGGWK